MPSRRRPPLRIIGWDAESLENRRLLTIKFQFDYRYDSNHFFDSPQARALLEQAGQLLGSRLSDSLQAINPSGSNSWIAYFNPPSDLSAVGALENLTIPSDTLVVFVGARDIEGTAVAESAPGGFYTISTDQNWRDLLMGRGQTGAVPQNGAVATDFGPWGGSLSFDTATNWFFGNVIDGIGSSQIDFLSVAQHELGHLLGFGTAESFDRLIVGDTFTGPKATAAYDGIGSPPLSGDRGHWMDGLIDDGMSAAMDPTLGPATRRLFTDLDFAALEDLGWNGNGQGASGQGTVIIAGAANLQTTEAGGTASFTAVLSTRPTADVIINLTDSNPNESFLSHTSLIFTPQNWNQPQMVVITGVDDVVVDGSTTHKIITSPVISDDPTYNGFDPPDLLVTNVDNDKAGITVSATSGLATSEAGGTSSFTVVLNTQPASEVTIGVTSSNPAEGTVSLPFLIFTPTNWMIPQTVTVTGVNDNVSDVDNLYTIVLSQAASNDPLYSGMNPDDVSVLSISLPDQPASIILSPDELTVRSQGSPVLLDALAAISDPDSPFHSLVGAKLVVAVNRNASVYDRLTILHEGSGSGQVGVSTTSPNLSYGGIVIGSWTGGAGTTPLTITFNGRANLSIVQRLLRNLQFRSSSANRSTLDRSVTMKFVTTDGKSSNTATKLVHVTTGPIAPVINLGGGSLSYKNRSGAQLVAPQATLVDADSPTFTNGVLTVSLLTPVTGDVLKIRRMGNGIGQIDATTDGKLKYGNTLIGTWTGGTKGKSLVIKLKSTATREAVQALIRTITFETSSSNSSFAARTIQFKLTDGSGGTSNPVTTSVAIS